MRLRRLERLPLTLAFVRWNSLRVTHRLPSERGLPALLLGAALAAGLVFVDLETVELHLAVAALTVTLALIVAGDPATRRLGWAAGSAGRDGRAPSGT